LPDPSSTETLPGAVMPHELVLIRHAQTEWSAIGRHTSRTDVDLTAAGEQTAAGLAGRLAGHGFVAVFCSPRRRARRTAELAGLTVTALDDDLTEWDYGDYEGRTTAEIHDIAPDWTLWTDGAPGGESPATVAERADRVLDRVRPLLEVGEVALVGHGHALRVLAARWIGLPPTAGALLKLDAGTVSTLGFEHDKSVISLWNLS
jgi:broad specificity phosphatase PhoE